MIKLHRKATRCVDKAKNSNIIMFRHYQILPCERKLVDQCQWHIPLNYSNRDCWALRWVIPVIINSLYKWNMNIQNFRRYLYGGPIRSPQSLRHCYYLLTFVVSLLCTSLVSARIRPAATRLQATNQVTIKCLAFWICLCFQRLLFVEENPV